MGLIDLKAHCSRVGLILRHTIQGRPFWVLELGPKRTDLKAHYSMVGPTGLIIRNSIRGLGPRDFPSPEKVSLKVMLEA